MEEKIEKVRLNVFITREIYDQLGELARKTSLTRPRVAVLAIAAGLDAIRLATDPNWKAYFEATIKNEREKQE